MPSRILSSRTINYSKVPTEFICNTDIQFVEKCSGKMNKLTSFKKGTVFEFRKIDSDNFATYISSHNSKYIIIQKNELRDLIKKKRLIIIRTE